jgi:excisionase family DNA binding protein
MKDEMMQAASVLLQSYYIGINARELEKALDAHYASGKGTHPTEVLSPKQYAQKNGISLDTVMRLIHAGKIEYKRIGRQYRIIVKRRG